MDLQALLLKPGDLLEDLTGTVVEQQAPTQRRFGGMNRNKQWREPLPLDALPVRCREVGEGEIGAVEKAQAIVIVLEIKA